MGGRGNAGARSSGSTSTTPATRENEYGFEVENTDNPDIAFNGSWWKQMAELKSAGHFEDSNLRRLVDDRISDLVDKYGDLERYDSDLTSIRERIDYESVTNDEYWAGYQLMANMLGIKSPRYYAGTGNIYDAYVDTQFGSIEEAEEWGRNRDLTHIYDSWTGKYRRIGGKNWRVGE